MVACQSELRLSHEATSSPKRAGYLTWKSFGGPGEPEASLGELGARKLNEKTLLPFLLVSFAFLIKTLNDPSFYAVIGVKPCSLASKKKNINEWQSPNEIRVWQVSLDSLRMPSSLWKWKNLSLAKGLVNISASCESVSTNSVSQPPLWIWS